MTLSLRVLPASSCFPRKKGLAKRARSVAADVLPLDNDAPKPYACRHGSKIPISRLQVQCGVELSQAEGAP
jgi:hypothetical protein